MTNKYKNVYTSLKAAVITLITVSIFIMIISSSCVFSFISYAEDGNGETTTFDDETLETKKNPESALDEIDERIIGYITLSDNAESLETQVYTTLLPETTAATETETTAEEGAEVTTNAETAAQTIKSEDELRRERLSDNNIGAGKYVLIAIAVCMVIITVMIPLLRRP